MTSNTRPLHSQALDMLRFPLAVIVVIVHTFSLSNLAVPGGEICVSSYSLFRDANMFVDAFLRGISVPIYFFISGYVFFAKVQFNGNVYWKKLKNRFKSLFIPYMIWNAFALLLILAKQLPIFDFFLSVNRPPLNLSMSTILECFWKCSGNINHSGEVTLTGSYFPINAALWYLRDLMLIVLSTPIIYWAAKRLKVLSVYLSLVIYVLSLIYNWPISMIASGYFFFTWGAYMSIYNIDMIVAFKKWGKLSIIMYLLNCVIYILICEGYPVIGSWIKLVNAIFALCASFNIAAWILNNTKLRVSAFLASSSFFIYVSHCIIYERLRKIIIMVFRPDNGVEILLVYIFTVIITVLLLLSAFYLLKKYAPSILKVIAGRK